MVVEEGPEDGVGKTVVVSISDVIVEIDSLAGVLLHQSFVDQRAILWGDEETRPADPGEVERFLKARESRNKSSRGHLKVVFPTGILGDGDGETI